MPGEENAWAQALGGAEKAKPVRGDPGVSSMGVIDDALFRVLRDYAEPGRRQGGDVPFGKAPK